MIEKKTYIQPESEPTGIAMILMQTTQSLPQGNDTDPVVDDEGDVLSKKHDNDEWGNLW